VSPLCHQSQNTWVSPMCHQSQNIWVSPLWNQSQNTWVSPLCHQSHNTWVSPVGHRSQNIWVSQCATNHKITEYPGYSFTLALPLFYDCRIHNTKKVMFDVIGDNHDIFYLIYD
jgi:hypothetical protein